MASGSSDLDEMGVDILDGLTSLVDKSLIRRTDQGAREPRLLMLETIREYARNGWRRTRIPSRRSPGPRRLLRRFHPASMGALDRRGSGGRVDDMEREIENVQAAWRYWVAEGISSNSVS